MSSTTQFLGAYVPRKISDLLNRVTVFGVQNDPQTSMEVQLSILEGKRVEYAHRLARAEQELHRHMVSNQDTASALNEAMLTLAKLKEKHEDTTRSPEKRARARRKACIVAAQIKRLNNSSRPEKERGKIERAKEIVELSRQLFDAATKRVDEAKGEIETARQQLAVAEANRDHARLVQEIRNEHEKFVGINIVFDALNKATLDAELETNVINLTSRRESTEASEIIAEELAEQEPGELDPDNPFSILDSKKIA